MPVSQPDGGPERAVALALAAAGDDEAAMGALYEECSDKLWHWIRRQAPDATITDDVHSETWLAVVQAIGSYDPAKASVLGWLKAIAGRKLIDHHRATGKRRTHELRASLIAGEALVSEQAQAARRGLLDGPGESAVVLATREQVRDVLKGLPPAMRDAVLLTIFDGLSMAEAAAELGCNEGAVKTARWRALMTLRDNDMEIVALLQGHDPVVLHNVNAPEKRATRRTTR